MRPGSVRSAVNVLTSIIAVNALIQNSTANSETSALSGRCRGTEGRKKLIGDKEARKPGNKEMRG
jgi:hypothetical protein